jgi:hypothetical protein
MFLTCSRRSATIWCIPDAPSLRPATADEIAEALSFALRYQGRKRVNHADDAMARGSPLSGFYSRVVMKGPATCGANDKRNAAWAGIGAAAPKEKSRPLTRPVS